MIHTDFDYWSLILNSDEKGARDIGEGQWRFAKTWASQKGCKGWTWLPWELQPSPSNWLQKTGKTAPKRQTNICNNKKATPWQAKCQITNDCQHVMTWGFPLSEMFLCSLKLTSCKSQNCKTCHLFSCSVQLKMENCNTCTPEKDFLYKYSCVCWGVLVSIQLLEDQQRKTLGQCYLCHSGRVLYQQQICVWSFIVLKIVLPSSSL